MVRRFEILLHLLETFPCDANADSRRGAGRSSGAHTGQVQADDIVSGEHVGLTRTAIGIAPGGFVFQAQDIEVESFIRRQIAHWNGDVVDGFNTKTNFCDHDLNPPIRNRFARVKLIKNRLTPSTTCPKSPLAPLFSKRGNSFPLTQPILWGKSGKVANLFS